MTATERSALRRARTRAARERAETARNGTVIVLPTQAVPPHTPPLCRDEGSGNEVAEIRPDSGSGEALAITLHVSGGGRELAKQHANSTEKRARAVGAAEVALARSVPRPRRGPLWHFVPDGWAPSGAHRAVALGLLLDVEAEADKFRNHEFSPPRSDPDRAFSGWLRRAREMNFRAGTNGRKTDLQKIIERNERIQKGAAE